MVDPRTPVLVGCAQHKFPSGDTDAPPSALDLMAAAATGACEDTGAKGVIKALDGIAVTRSSADSAPHYGNPFGVFPNLPKSLANRLGAAPRHHWYSQVGGNTPQWLVNHMAELIAAGEVDAVLLAGGENQRSVRRAMKAGLKLDWGDDPGGAPEVIGDGRMGVSPGELKYGIGAPAATYPLFENALAAHYGRGTNAHRQVIGRLFAPFSRIAAANPHAALPIERTAVEIATPTVENRMISWPYTKYMNSNDNVDQAAALIIMSSAKADALGIASEKRVYLHGSADTCDKWLVSERVNYHSSPAIRVGAAQALDMAGRTAAEMDFFDLYSCFPASVQIAADEIGLAHDDPRRLTVTGGLPYFGGPGNNYSMHAIAEMMGRLRAQPGSFGFVSALGWYITKHSFGVYSTAPPAAPFHRADPASYQGELDAMASPVFTELANGTGTIETFTVVFDRDGPVRGILIGRLDAGDARFLANTPGDKATLEALMGDGAIGRAINVTIEDGLNIARLACDTRSSLRT